MTSAGETAWAVTGFAVAGVCLAAVVALLVFFAVRRRAERQDAAFSDHPAGLGRRGLPDRQPPVIAGAPVRRPVTSPRPVSPVSPPAPADAGPAPADAAAPAPVVAVAAVASSAGTAGGPDRPAGSTPPRGRRRYAVPPIRLADPADLDRVAEILATAAAGVDSPGLGALPGGSLRGDPGPPTAAAILVAGRPAVAFVRIDEVDGLAHLDQLAMQPVVARRGIGKALVEAAIAWAAERRFPAMTLTTYRDSEWHERVYATCGFEPTTELTPGLVELRDWEKAIGLDSIAARVVLRRELSS